ncbi:tyrosine-type recombinase/integrase [Lacihabitans lacunae]|uniref:Tyrosine recombinase XerC n=1 Tax=Lacihabitans lacunae TaxID=1028214 RepID=A0ABV7YUM7_9BACT
MVDFFLSYLKNEKRLSAYTLKAYATDIKQFESFVLSFHENLYLEKASYQDIRAWIISLSDQKIDNKSINRKIATLRTFYKLLIQKGKISVDPTFGIKSLKKAKKLPVYVEETPMENLFDMVEYPNGYVGLRDRLILELLYSTGVRLSELINLKTLDVDFSGKQMKVLGKRNKYRIIPVIDQLIVLFKKYQQEVVSQFGQTSEFFILSDSGKKLYPVFVQRKVKHYLSQVTTISKKSPHILRHTFATHLLNRGAELNSIKELLGHASLAATQIYTHNTISQLKEIHKKSHPKA